MIRHGQNLQDCSLMPVRAGSRHTLMQILAAIHNFKKPRHHPKAV